MKIKKTNKRKQQKRDRARRYISLCLLVLLISCVLSACGGKAGQGALGSDGRPGQGATADSGLASPTKPAPDRDWVYLPESVVIEDVGVTYYGGVNNGIYYYACYEDYEEPAPGEPMDYSSRIELQLLRFCRYDIATGELEKVKPKWDVGEERWVGVIMKSACDNGNFWLRADKLVSREENSRGIRNYYILFDKEGNPLVEIDNTEYMDEKMAKNQGGGGSYSDRKGRIYDFLEDEIGLRGEDGDSAGSIPLELGIPIGTLIRVFDSFVETEDGKVRTVLRWGGEYNKPTNGILAEIDFENRKLTILSEDFKDIYGIGEAPEMIAGKTGYYDLLLYDETAVYGYSIADQKRDVLFAWKECSITGKEIYDVGTMPDGRIYAVIDDWGSEDHRIVLFTEVWWEDAPPVTTMVLATVGEIGDDLNATAMRFNRYNFPCCVEVKSYESVNDLYNALLTGEQIDILDLSRVKLSVLTGQGLLEDLSPYLEKNESGYHREDFVEGVLEAYTVDGILTGIPDSFSIRTVAGDLSRYGGSGGSGSSGGGLTLDAFLTAAEQNPDAKILEGFDGLTREELMEYLLMFNMEEFVNWETGECRFDSEQFKRVLDCVKRFREAGSEEYEEISLPTRLQSGEILYLVADMNSLMAVDLYQVIFEKEDVCIGFPTPDGSGGHLLITNDAYGILATSGHKDAA